MLPVLLLFLLFNLTIALMICEENQFACLTFSAFLSYLFNLVIIPWNRKKYQRFLTLRNSLRREKCTHQTIDGHDWEYDNNNFFFISSWTVPIFLVQKFFSFEVRISNIISDTYRTIEHSFYNHRSKEILRQVAIQSLVYDSLAESNEWEPQREKNVWFSFITFIITSLAWASSQKCQKQ